MPDETLLQTIFHDWHVATGGRMVEFGGWHMPVQYSTIVDEHNAVRNALGVFDVAHMGRLRFDGPDACRFLDHVLTNDVTKLQPGQVRYSLVTNEAGGILDDVLVYRIDDGYMLVVNASNREKIFGWLETHRTGFHVEIDDRSQSHPMLALQGPRSVELMTALGCGQAADMKYYSIMRTTVGGFDALLSRTGYTGEDGFEVIVESEQALALLDKVCEAGQPLGLQPAGLGCRDTLRLEAAMPLYGHELNEQTDPLTAGLGFGVKIDAADFIGRDALLKIRESGTSRVRVGLTLEGRRIAREGAALVRGDEVIGEVTSGTFSPTLEKPISMAYVERKHSDTNIALDVDIRGKRVAARTVDLPFYRRPKAS